MSMMSMKVIKRDGRQEEVSFDKVLTRIQLAAKDLEVNPTLIAQRTLLRIYDGVKTTELDELAAQLSISLMTTNPDYGILASRIAISNHHRNTSDKFTEVVKELSHQVIEKTGEVVSNVSEELVRLCELHGDVIDARMDYQRDYNLDYFGFKTLEKLQYLLRNTKGKTLERPQHLMMRVSLALWGSTDLDRAFQTYDLLSQKYFIHATPTNFNAGTPRQQLSSCFLLAMKGNDSIAGIYDTLKDCAMISKYAGGIGLHIHDIRAKGSLIRGTNGTSNGIVPMLRNFNDTARYVDQCFTPDTLVLTESGPQPIGVILPGEKVLTSEGVFHTVLKQVIHEYSGRMFRIQLEDHQEAVQVTEEHPILSFASEGHPLEHCLKQIQAGLKEVDYREVKELQVGDFTVFPHGQHGRIQSIEPVEYTGIVHDFEIDGPHDYTVAHLGIAHNGGGKRNGSFAIYLEPWHADVEDFLKLKLNTGSEEERCRDLFYALWVPDLFMERVEKNEPWTLFCPSEAPGLSDVYGEEFRALYTRYEQEGRGRKQVDAQKLWFRVLDSQIETGTPYLLYKDACNKKSNQKNLGTIKSSNLCVAPETLILTDKGQFPIHTLAGQEVRVWNGEKWSTTTVQKTGEGQRLVTVHLSNGAQLMCTPYHKFLIREGYEDKRSIKDAKRVDASDLTPGMTLLSYRLPESDQEVTLLVTEVTDEGRTDDTYCFNEPENHAGVFNGVLAGNCSEIVEYSSPDETAVCNLASIALPSYVSPKTRTFDFKKLREVVKVVIKNLNRVIDINFYPTPETKTSNMRHRPVGLGVQGLADVFALLRVPWESEKAAELNQLIFEHIYFAAVESSCEIAQEEGPYSTFEGSPMSQGLFQYDLWNVTPLTSTEGRIQWTGVSEEKDRTLPWADLKARVKAHGVRNSLLVAPMPTASTSQIMGFNEACETFTSNIYTRRTLAGEFVVINKYLMADLKKLDLWNEMMKQQIIARNGSVQGIDLIPESIQRLYKTSWEVKQKTIIDMAAARGAFICQSQSLNLFVADPNYAKLTSMHFYGWKRGLKTGVYYLRTRAPVMAQKFTIDPDLQKAAAKSEMERIMRQNTNTGTEECLMCGS
jgi:ribonucleotide reductase alpha subunit